MNFSFPLGVTRSSQRTTHRCAWSGLEDATLEGLAAKVAPLLAKAEAIAGRPLTSDDLRHGVPRKDQRSRQQIAELAARHHRDHHPLAPPKSPEQLKVELAAARVETERRAKLTPAESYLEDAKAELAAKERADAQSAAAATIRETAGYRQLRASLDEALFRAKYDATITPEVMAELAHQSAMLEMNLDVSTVKSNVSTIRNAIVTAVEAERTALKASQDALAARESLLADSPWDDLTTEVVGNVEYVALTKNGQTVKMSKQRFDGRQSDDALAAELFAEPANA